MTKRYYRAEQVEIGGQVITLEPLRGLKAITALNDAMLEEIQNLKHRYETLGGSPANPEHLLVDSIDCVKLLKIGCPQLTDETIENSMQIERLGLLEDVLRANGLAHLVPFVSPATLLELGFRLQERGRKIMEDQFGSLESSENSSEPVSLGETSTTS